MRKILVAFDGPHFSTAVLDFAARLNEKSRVLVTGVFLPQTSFVNLWSFSGGSGPGGELIPLVEEQDAKTIQRNVKKFETFCIDHNIDYRVHKDYFDFALPELKVESRFADLLIISSDTFYKEVGTGEPNDYLKETLHKVECPVIVIPEKFEFPACNILTYDGSESSVYAIKQFAYLLPELVNNETTLIYAKEKAEEQLPNEMNIAELAARHFKNMNLFRFEANPKKYFNSWLLEKKAGIVVSGAYGRSGLSRMFHKSFVSEIIREHRLPVFITHK
jgi:nucleotide-binding universal stress UspA family protein